MKNILFFSLICVSVHSCKSPRHTVAGQGSSSANETKELQDIKVMQEKGVELFAQGSTPVNWNLQMNFDDTIRFYADDGLSLKCAYNRLKKDINADRSIFSATIQGGNLAILIEAKDCSLPSKKEIYRKKVTVTFNTSTYSGCGKFLADDLLSNKWLLEKIGDKLINSAEYNRVPVFQIDIAQGRITGNDGCNSISGKIEVQGNRIKFYPIAQTEIGCMKKNISKIISEQISDNLVDYYFKNGKLYLYLPDDSLLIFKKI